jgi:hypothetical protein
MKKERMTPEEWRAELARRADLTRRPEEMIALMPSRGLRSEPPTVGVPMLRGQGPRLAGQN